MNLSEMTKTVKAEFNWLSRKVAGIQEAERLLQGAFQAAKDGERKHRKYVDGRYLVSVDVAAKYFVVKFYAEPRSRARHAEKTTHLDASRMRLDNLYMQALYELLKQMAFERLPRGERLDSLAPRGGFRTLGIDYSKDFVQMEGS